MHVPERLRGLGREPWVVLLPLVLVQWGALAAFALTVRHNGWLYYQGGDQTWYYTTAWVLSDGQIPQTAVGWGWPYFLAPIAALAGPDFLAALPAAVLVNVLILVPLALLLVYALAARVGGRVVGYLAAGLWVALPYAAIPLFIDRYHDRFVEQFLPQALGFTQLADYPSLVALLAAAYFTLRALDGRDALDGVIAGLLAGFAAGIKPANLIFLAAPVAAFALARRAGALVAFAAGLVLPLAALYVWKLRGLGQTPIALVGDERLAATLLATFGPLDPYLDFGWSQLRANYVTLREVFWSARALVWLPVAGVVAVALRSRPKAALLGVWLLAFVLLKGGSERATVDSGNFFRFVMPAFPAWVVLAASLPLLVPTVGRRLAQRFRAGSGRTGWKPLVPAAVLLGALPLGVAAGFGTLDDRRAVKAFPGRVFISVSEDFALHGATTAEGVFLRWNRSDGDSARVFYRVYRRPLITAARPDAIDPNQARGIRCDGARGRAWDCTLEMTLAATTRARKWLDRPPPGNWTYRVAAASNWRDDPTLGDPLVLSEPLDALFP